MRLSRRTLWLVAGLASFAGCGDPGGPDERRLDVEILFAPMTIGIGDSVALEPRVTWHINDRSTPEPIVWRSLEPAVASVDTAGMLRGLAVGAARIVLDVHEASDTVTVRVAAIPRGLRVVLPRDTLVVGASVTPTAVLVLDGRGGVIDTARTFTLTSSDSLTVAVDGATGALTALRDGDVELTATVGTLSFFTPVHARYHEPLAGSVPTGAAVTHVAVTREFGCARASNGQVFCWGQAGAPRFGNGLTAQTTPLTPVTSAATFEDVRIVRATACGRVSGVGVHCWVNEPAVTGPLAGTATVATPTRLPLPDSAGAIVELVHGWFFDECARNSAGRLWCWGDNAHNAIGPRASDDSTAFRARRLEGAPAFARASIGEGHGCGVTEAGALWCWGDATWPYHASQATPTSRVPEPVVTPRPVRDVAAAFQSTCTIDDAGAIDCWGFNQGGAVDARQDQASFVGRTRVDVPGNFARIRAGGAGVCALTVDRDLWCWGALASQQGGARAPFRFSLQHKFVDFAIGSVAASAVVCGLTTAGRVLCNMRWSAD